MDNTLASRLVQARSQRGQSQMELATSSGVAAAQISRYESGRSKPRTEVVARLAKALDVSFEWLLNGALEQSGDVRTTVSKVASSTHADPEAQEKSKTTLLEREGPRLVRAADPINIDSAQLQHLAVQLVGFHAERAALQQVVERLKKVHVDGSALNGIERQLAAVEADILDTQEELRILIKE